MNKIRSRDGGILNKGKQASFILRTALLTLEKQGESRCSRSRVLCMIRVKKFVIYNPISGDVWVDSGKLRQQFFSWCREDITTDELMAWRGAIDNGFWRLSDAGREKTKQQMLRWFSSGKTANEILTHYQQIQFETIFSLNFVDHVLKVASTLERSH